MLMTMFEIAAGYECGGPEDGMMCREGRGEFECEVNLFQPIEKIYEEVEAQYRELCENEPGFLGCRCIRIIPKDEADEIRKYWKWLDEHCIDGDVIF